MPTHVENQTAPLPHGILLDWVIMYSYRCKATRAWRNGRRGGLRQKLSARWETGDAELLKFGEPC